MVTVTGWTLGIGSNRILPATQNIVSINRIVYGLEFSILLDPLRIAKTNKERITMLIIKSCIGVNAKVVKVVHVSRSHRCFIVILGKERLKFKESSRSDNPT